LKFSKKNVLCNGDTQMHIINEEESKRNGRGYTNITYFIM